MRKLENDKSYLRVSYFILPNLSAFPGQTGGEGYSINWHVPIDDTHHWKYTFVYSAGAPLKKDLVNRERSELGPDYRLVRNEANRFLQDREAMKTKTYAGMGSGFQAHDAFATASQGAVQDRTEEQLVSSDKAIVAARKLMEKAISDVREGRGAAARRKNRQRKPLPPSAGAFRHDPERRLEGDTRKISKPKRGRKSDSGSSFGHGRSRRRQHADSAADRGVALH